MNSKFYKIISSILITTIVISLFVISPLTVSAFEKTDEYKKYVKYRGQDLQNVYSKLSKGEEVNVLYFGGSVTDGSDIGSIKIHNWRERVGEWLIASFPDATINNVNVAYGGTGTRFGSYRLNEEVIKRKPDLIFIEFAINDSYDLLSMNESSMYFESIVRQIRLQLPTCDIVTVLITDKGSISTSLVGNAKAHENICTKYNIPSIHVGLAFSYFYFKNNPDWYKYFYDSVHPIDPGYEFYFNVIKEYMANCLLSGEYDGSIVEHTVPELVNDVLMDGNIQFFDASEEMVAASNALGGSGFVYSDSASQLAYTFLGGLSSVDSNPSLVYEFTGTELGLLISSGSNTEVQDFTVTIDQNTTNTVPYSSIRPVILATGLNPGKHTVKIVPNYKEGKNKGLLYVGGFFTRDETLASHKHKFDSFVSNNDATCEQDGTKTATCSICKISDTIADEGSKLGHSFTDYVYNNDATCIADGTKTAKCDNCDATDTVAATGTAGHKYANDSDLDCDVCGELRIGLEPTLVKDAETGKWFYYVDGEKSTETALVKYSGKWFYVQNGEWDAKVTSLVKYSGKWFYVKNGKWDSKTEDLVKHNGKYFYIKNGKWNSKDKTLFKKNGKWFAISAGKWYKGETLITYSGKKFYVNKGFAQLSFSGKKKINGKTYTIKKGKVV